MYDQELFVVLIDHCADVVWVFGVFFNHSYVILRVTRYSFSYRTL
jgi:hypothetical protein